jgi:hypothetical protein
MSKKSKSKFSIRSLAKKFGTDRATATKVLAGITDEQEARAALQAWSEQRVGKSLTSDPDTGLSWWQARLREDVMKARSGRERDKQLAGGDLVPVGVIEQAAAQVGYAFDKLANSAYVYGVPLDESGRAVIDRLGQQAKQDFNTWIKQTLDRQRELAAEQGPAAAEADGECPPNCMPMTTILAMDRIICGRLESLPARAQSEIKLPQPEVVKLLEIIKNVRDCIADDMIALKTPPAADGKASAA